MNCKVIVQPPAVADLDEAYRWIAERLPEKAARNTMTPEEFCEA